jgi:hypothetical protein
MLKATILQAAGVAVVALGVGLWFAPAGVIAAGVGLVLFGLALERK